MSERNSTPEIAAAFQAVSGQFKAEKKIARLKIENRPNSRRLTKKPTTKKHQPATGNQ